MRKIWPFAFNLFLFAGVASLSPFIVLYYQELGFTGVQIGVLTGITPLITFFSAPIWTGFADAKRRHRFLMSIAILGAVAALVVYPLLDSFVSVLLIAIALNVFTAPITPFADSATMFMLADRKDMYGRIRLGGTIGYGLAASIAGVLVQKHGLKLAFWGCAGLFLLGFLVSQKLVYGQSEADLQIRGRAQTLLTNPRWLLFLAVALGAGCGLAALSNYFFPYLQGLGASESTMGLALTVGTISEIPVLFFVHRLIKRFKPYRLLTLSMVVTGLRMLLFAATSNPTLVLFVQLLNGLTFAVTWVAGVSYAEENAPEGMHATAQGLFGATALGFGTAVGGLIGGPLLEKVGGRGLYLVFGTFVLAIVVVVTLIRKRLPAEQGTPPAS